MKCRKKKNSKNNRISPPKVRSENDIMEAAAQSKVLAIYADEICALLNGTSIFEISEMLVSILEGIPEMTYDAPSIKFTKTISQMIEIPDSFKNVKTEGFTPRAADLPVTLVTRDTVFDCNGETYIGLSRCGCIRIWVKEDSSPIVVRGDLDNGVVSIYGNLDNGMSLSIAATALVSSYNKKANLAFGRDLTPSDWEYIYGRIMKYCNVPVRNDENVEIFDDIVEDDIETEETDTRYDAVCCERPDEKIVHLQKDTNIKLSSRLSEEIYTKLVDNLKRLKRLFGSISKIEHVLDIPSGRLDYVTSLLEPRDLNDIKACGSTARYKREINNITVDQAREMGLCENAITARLHPDPNGKGYVVGPVRWTEDVFNQIIVDYREAGLNYVYARWGVSKLYLVKQSAIKYGHLDVYNDAVTYRRAFTGQGDNAMTPEAAIERVMRYFE